MRRLSVYINTDEHSSSIVLTMTIENNDFNKKVRASLGKSILRFPDSFAQARSYQRLDENYVNITAMEELHGLKI